MPLLFCRPGFRTRHQEGLQNARKYVHVALIFLCSPGKVVADGIRNDAETYNEAILGLALSHSGFSLLIRLDSMPPATYISKILTPSTWGGAIELGILASHYGTEIASIDVETGRIDQFAPRGVENPDNRCLLIYSGIHYDAATLAPMADAPSDWHQTVFPTVSFGSSARCDPSPGFGYLSSGRPTSWSRRSG